MSKLQESGTPWMHCGIAKADTRFRKPYGRTRAVALDYIHAVGIKHLAVHVQEDWQLSPRAHHPRYGSCNRSLRTSRFFRSGNTSSHTQNRSPSSSNPRELLLTIPSLNTISLCRRVHPCGNHSRVLPSRWQGTRCKACCERVG